MSIKKGFRPITGYSGIFSNGGMIFFVVSYCCILTLAEGAAIKETDSVEDIETENVTEINLYENEQPKSFGRKLHLKDLSNFAIPHKLTPSGHQLWEGDLILSKQQVEGFYGRTQKRTFMFRKATTDLKTRWPDGIIYYRLLNSSEPDREVIKSAIKHWMDNTCLKFYEVDDNFKANHIYFNKSEGCFSDLGMMNSKKGIVVSIGNRRGMSIGNGQAVSIGKDCAYMGIVAHEIGHAIGFVHEHNRPDRDEYIKVIIDNIKPKKIWVFAIMNKVNNYEIPYDLTSVMHYDSTSESFNGKKTIVTHDPTKEFLIGQRNGLSFADLKLANIMYKCADRCKEKPKCDNGGFINHKCECICPPEFTGSECHVPVKPPKKICGGNFTSKFLSSPNYPKNYPKRISCFWIIKAPAKKKIRLFFHNFDLYQPENNTCKKDYLEVRIGKDYDGNKYCGNQLVRKKLYLHSGEALLIFKSKKNKNRGFYMDISYI